MQQQACANPNTLRTIKEGDNFSYHIASKEGLSLGDFTISACHLPLPAKAQDELNEALVATVNKLNEQHQGGSTTSPA